MKLIAALSLLFSVSSFACSTYEAQFSAKVKEVIADANDPYSCFVKLDINLSRGDSYQMHSWCPLLIEEALFNDVLVKNCRYKAGDRISGYLVKTESGIELD